MNIRLLSKKEFQRGQVLLIVVLVMVVSLTVGLSVATRTITNLRLSTEEEQSQRALSAAEAGIERALQSGSTEGTVVQDQELSNDANISKVTVDQIVEAEFLINSGNKVTKNDGVDIWLSTYSSDSDQNYANPWTGELEVFWGSSSDSCLANSSNTMAALEVVVLSGTKNNPTAKHFPVDPCTQRRANYNNFCPNSGNSECPSYSSAGGSVSGKQFAYSFTIPVTSGLIARIVPLYAGTAIGVKGRDGSGAGKTLPPQGTVIESIGTSGTTQRKITLYRGYPKVPTEFFPFMIFSP